MQLIAKTKNAKPPETNPLRQFAANPTSRVYAIKAKCAECVGCTLDHLEPGYSSSIRDCSSYSCPLYNFRPYRSKRALTSV